VFEDNTKSWSGDHCVDPKLVPGVLLSNRPINTSTPDIKDMAPTVLNLFGVEIPPYMQGRPLFAETDGRETFQPEEKEKWVAPGQTGQAA
jgi:bisphosphoglycerate-independent phosphoglycerate mutase (AlkP superfamily)